MSVNPVFIVDHDLPADSAERLIHKLSEKADGNFDVVLSKNILQIISLSQNWDKEFDCYSWDGLNDIFMNHIGFARNWKERIISQIREILFQDFHCTKLLIVKDTLSPVHQFLHETCLSDKEITVDEALMNTENYAKEIYKQFKVLKDDEVFNHSRNLEEPIFLFNL